MSRNCCSSAARLLLPLEPVESVELVESVAVLAVVVLLPDADVELSVLVDEAVVLLDWPVSCSMAASYSVWLMLPSPLVSMAAKI